MFSFLSCLFGLTLPRCGGLTRGIAALNSGTRNPKARLCTTTAATTTTTTTTPTTTTTNNDDSTYTYTYNATTSDTTTPTVAKLQAPSSKFELV